MQSGKIMQFWSAEAVSFMADATEYSDFYRKLTEILLPYLPKDGHICDAGCGLAALGRELSAHCAQVTAIDSSEIAVTAAKSRPLPENMEIFCADLHEVERTFDAMIFCYFGRIGEILEIAGRMCREKVVIIKRSCAEHHFSLTSPPAAMRRTRQGKRLTDWRSSACRGIYPWNLDSRFALSMTRWPFSGSMTTARSL